jgi:hypothetical protein
MPMAKRTSFLVPTELRKIAAQAVADDRRSLSSLVVLALEEYLGKGPPAGAGATARKIY